MIGWVIAGLVGILISGVLMAFWDNIVNWLNHTAADAVEKVLGYEARKKMHRAVVIVDRLYNKVRNKGIIYTRDEIHADCYRRVTYTAEALEQLVDDEVLREIDKEKELINNFEYRQ